MCCISLAQLEVLPTNRPPERNPQKEYNTAHLPRESIAKESCLLDLNHCQQTTYMFESLLDLWDK